MADENDTVVIEGTEKKSGGKPPACVNTTIPDWIKPALAELATALGEKGYIVIAAAIAHFLKLPTAEQFAAVGPVKMKHCDAVKAVLAGEV